MLIYLVPVFSLISLCIARRQKQMYITYFFYSSLQATYQLLAKSKYIFIKCIYSMYVVLPFILRTVTPHNIYNLLGFESYLFICTGHRGSFKKFK